MDIIVGLYTSTKYALRDGDKAFGYHVLIFLVGHLYLSAHVERLVVKKLETRNTHVAMN